MERVSKHIHYLELLAKPASQEQASALVATASEDQLNCVSELALNLLSGRIDLTRHYKSLLAKEADVIRRLGDRELGPRKRKSVAQDNVETVVKILAICLKRIG